MVSIERDLSCSKEVSALKALRAKRQDRQCLETGVAAKWGKEEKAAQNLRNPAFSPIHKEKVRVKRGARYSFSQQASTPSRDALGWGGREGGRRGGGAERAEARGAAAPWGSPLGGPRMQGAPTPEQVRPAGPRPLPLPSGFINSECPTSG